MPDITGFMQGKSLSIMTDCRLALVQLRVYLEFLAKELKNSSNRGHGSSRILIGQEEGIWKRQVSVESVCFKQAKPTGRS